MLDIVESAQRLEPHPQELKTALTVGKIRNKSLLLEKWAKNGLESMAAFSKQHNRGMAGNRNSYKRQLA
jgi:hypothetical protein